MPKNDINSLVKEIEALTKIIEQMSGFGKRKEIEDLKKELVKSLKKKTKELEKAGKKELERRIEKEGSKGMKLGLSIVKLTRALKSALKEKGSKLRVSKKEATYTFNGSVNFLPCEITNVHITLTGKIIIIRRQGSKKFKKRVKERIALTFLVAIPETGDKVYFAYCGYALKGQRLFVVTEKEFERFQNSFWRDPKLCVNDCFVNLAKNGIFLFAPFLPKKVDKTFFKRRGIKVNKIIVNKGDYSITLLLPIKENRSLFVFEGSEDSKVMLSKKGKEELFSAISDAFNLTRIFKGALLKEGVLIDKFEADLKKDLAKVTVILFPKPREKK